MIVSVGVVGTGLTLWFLKSSLGPDWLAFTTLMHDLCMLGLTLFLVGHLYFTYVYKALSGMTTGYISSAEARLEHSKWVAELEAAAAGPATTTNQTTTTPTTEKGMPQ